MKTCMKKVLTYLSMAYILNHENVFLQLFLIILEITTKISQCLNDVLQAGLEELLPHERDLGVLSHPAKNFLPFKLKVSILDAVGW